MSRRSKGPRLYLRPGRPDRGSPEVYVIRGGPNEISTGCGPDCLRGPGGAEEQLAAYITSKYKRPPAADPTLGPGDPAAVLIADVVAYYAKERAPHVADPTSTGIRLRNIATWWAGKTLADIRRSSCQDYVAHRVSQPIAQAKTAAAMRFVTHQSARRELEGLSAAIGYWHEEYPLTRRPAVWMPEKKESPRDALTRHQAARLLMAARGRRWDANSAKWIKIGCRAMASRAHLRRFVLIGLYTGSRPGVIPKLLKHASATQAWVDLDRETIFRRGKSEVDHATKRRPLVQMPRLLVAHMRRWFALDERLAEARAAEAKARGDALRPAPATVLHHAGKPIAGRIRKGFATLVADAGLDPEITPHWMRHTCATWLMEKGMTVSTLEKVYGHHRPDFQASARRALSGRSSSVG